MTAQALIDELALSLDVSAHDVETLARFVISALERDSGIECFVKGRESDQVSITAAYMDEAIKMLRRMVNNYLTNPLARQTLEDAVLTILKESES